MYQYSCTNSLVDQNMVGANCACGLFHPSNTQCPFSMFWGTNTQYASSNYQYDVEPTDQNYYASANYASPNSSVDCTLSLGTPSTRLSNAGSASNDQQQQQQRPRRSVSNFCWDLLHPKKSTNKSANNNNTCSSSENHVAVAADPLVARRCANCDTTSTPLWRNGPRGPKSLCNACGIRFKKEERRASAAAAAAANNTTTHNHHYSTSAAASGINMSIDANGYYGTTTSNPWTAAAHHQTQKIQCFSPPMGGNEFRFIY